MAQPRSRQRTRSSPRSSSGGSGRRGATTTARARGGGDSTLPSVPGWLWLLGGGLVGVATFFVLQNMHGEGAERGPAEPREVSLAPPAEEASTERAQAAEANDEPDTAEESRERSYDFYELLMQDEVVIPEDEPPPSAPRTPRRDETASRAPTVEAGYDYLLQAGSFRSAEDADRLRAMLTLTGLPAQIHTVELDDGQRWHRVRVGPFNEAEEIEQARGRMKENNIEPLLLRQGG
ncbi:hypothetical protein CKO15_02630 [Halorhodospira abdelmalekii]|uniref:SPOR domain-containing protein n=1 Tax=Halorhodospira abdelmalekii TaxID=421629 RepID=UPI0019031ACA|nr:SPOR domain-containing protein [Halorhodospira abdelmalekii]MBK1734195.1 hypothetical protein [Halorhodospira abdelmalekii]